MRIELSGILLAVGLLGSTAPAAPARPNIVLILADDLGWGDLGCYPKGEAWGPEARVPTPNLDALAASGVRCTQAYATAMVCAPSRAALLTGQYQQRFGFYAFAETAAPFPADLKLLPEALREAGYRTGMIGKWHLSSRPESGPLQRGFDRFFGFIGGQHDYFEMDLGTPMQGVRNTRDAHIFDQDRPVTRGKYLTEEFTDRALDFIADSAHPDRPFFLYLPYNAPHPPNQAPWEDLAPYAAERPDGRFTPRDIARAMIGNLDRNVGRLITNLRQRGLFENTLIIFTSDNGGSDPGPGRVLQHNGGLRGRKSTFYEGGIRVPLILSWPGRLPAGTTYDQPVSLLDVYPTALAAAEPPKVETQPLDGVNLLPFLVGTETSPPHLRLFWTIETPSRWAVRDGDWKLVYEDTDPATLGQRDLDREMRVQLFDLARDPREEKDLAAQEPDRVAALRRLLDQFNAHNRPSLYTPDVRAAHEAALADRAGNPSLQESPSRSGAPGHWKGAAKRPASTPSSE